MIASLELRSISKKYIPHALILNSVNYTFLQGTSYAITGSSGSGKSTLLHILSLLEKPTHGSVLHNAIDCSLFSQQEKSLFLQTTVGIVFQNPHLLQDLTIIENILLPGLLSGLSWNESFYRAEELLLHVGLQDKQNNFPSELSGGQQQRVALARALFNNPSFILADEPTGNLDTQTGSAIIALLVAYKNKHNAGLIISTHDQALVQRMEHVCTIEKGILTSHPTTFALSTHETAGNPQQTQYL